MAGGRPAPAEGGKTLPPGAEFPRAGTLDSLSCAAFGDGVVQMELVCPALGSGHSCQETAQPPASGSLIITDCGRVAGADLVQIPPSYVGRALERDGEG